jgi:Ca-activated chloride channel family protein
MTLRRQIKNSLLPLLLVFAAQKMCAQLLPADDFFNGGAQLYISNNVPAALERTESGLKLYPDDVKLKKLEELLKQQQQSQSQQDSKNGQQNQRQSQQQSQQNSQNQKKDEQQKQSEQQKSSAETKDGQKPDNQNAEGQPVAPGEMTPEEAKRLLDAQKGNEQVLQLIPQGKPQDQNKPVKDW